MAQKIQVRRGTTAQRQAIVLGQGEPGFDTDLKRLFVGDGATAGGVDIAPPVTSFKNKLINGNFDIWQRGTNVVYSNNFGAGNAAGYGPDRWSSQTFGGPTSTGTSQCTMAIQAFTPGQTSVPGEPIYFARLNAPSVPTIGGGSATIRCSQQIEDVRTINGTYTFSIWLKADSARTIGVTLFQNFGSGGSATTMAFQIQQAVTTSWVRYTYTFVAPSLSGKTIGTSSSFYVMLWIYAQDNALVTGMTIAPFGTNSTTAFLDMSRAQLEPGAVATDFEQRPISIEQSLCERYCPAFVATSNLHFICSGQAANPTSMTPCIVFRTKTRVPPTSIVISSGAHFSVSLASTVNSPCSNLIFGSASTEGSVLVATTTGLVAGNFSILFFNNTGGRLVFEGCELP